MKATFRSGAMPVPARASCSVATFTGFSPAYPVALLNTSTGIPEKTLFLLAGRKDAPDHGRQPAP
jgi:hypothetical protein